MKQNDKMESTTKQKIVDVSKALFAQKGYAATSIKDICEGVQCSKGAIYHHFENKEDLFNYITKQIFTASWNQWIEIASNYQNMIDKLYVFADFFVESMQRQLSKAAEEYLKSTASEESRIQFIGYVGEYMNNFESFIEEGILSGQFKQENPKELAFIILSFYSGLADSYNFMSKDEMKLLFHKATTLLLEGIKS
ncbi:TetR/AcrR family transcriptional regulator [Paenibacillus sp. N1-5-1-14]|uniref:TetR/AcrR family transcriptional regulator n=1 Tax=Paenibacillus radicibacter TaxID=2972488 RepID=UPI0021599669|nr:TetR/AcrR family transcriptional regulator [Paenibacillus radicibacter]MCR8643375.1 TetR/AcrR family transcriptional regulator [Paenibacillus radicibacter]